MALPTLVYCAGGNRRFAQIAMDAGFQLGAQLPDTVYVRPLYFADQNWKNPNRSIYMKYLTELRPIMASVLDWERPEQLGEVLGWAEEAAAFVETVMIIPKVQGGVALLPRTIGGKPIRLGYSVPTKHGGTELGLWEFVNWPVHLLGGNPGSQMQLARYLDVQSADGNMSSKLAIKNCQFWKPGKKPYRNYWPSLTEADGKRLEEDGPYEAFRRSCENIMAAWCRITKSTRS